MKLIKPLTIATCILFSSPICAMEYAKQFGKYLQSFVSTPKSPEQLKLEHLKDLQRSFNLYIALLTQAAQPALQLTTSSGLNYGKNQLSIDINDIRFKIVTNAELLSYEIENNVRDRKICSLQINKTLLQGELATDLHNYMLELNDTVIKQMAPMRSGNTFRENLFKPSILEEKPGLKELVPMKVYDSANLSALVRTIQSRLDTEISLLQQLENHQQ